MRRWRLLHGDCVEIMAKLPSGSIDAIVTDPPYGLEFMGKGWDKLSPGWMEGATANASVGLGDRETAWVSYSGETANPTCASCGGRRRGANVCACGAPDWRVRGEPYDETARRATKGARQQAWHAQWLAEALRVLKPGGHLVAFGGTRTFHRLVCAAEDVGFEIRDTLTWHYGQGFPKNHDIGKAIDKAAWDGWGTALKPATEPILLARKPLTGTVAANVLAHGTGAINIDGCRVATAPGDDVSLHGRSPEAAKGNQSFNPMPGQTAGQTPGQALGRYPANLLLTHHPECAETGTATIRGDRRKSPAGGGKRAGGFVDTGAASGSPEPGGRVYGDQVTVNYDCHEDCPVRIMDEQSGPTGAAALASGPTLHGPIAAGGSYGSRKGIARKGVFHANSEGASRFFYTAKASNGGRWGYCHTCGVAFNRKAGGHPKTGGHNVEWHPTVKPAEIMRWLCRLVTPPGGVLLDPFAGTGTTLVAGLVEGFRVVGIERERAAAGGHPYIEITAARLRKESSNA